MRIQDIKIVITSILFMCLGQLAAVEIGPLYKTPQDCPSLAKPAFINLPQARAYPGVEYNIRACVKGGTWPYAFSLDAAPQGMQIDAKKGVISWTPDREALGIKQVTVAAKDSNGLTAKQSFEISVGKEGFYFVSPDGDDANPGTYDQPWKTVMRAAGGNGVQDPANAVLYLRGGLYLVDVPAVKGKSAKNSLRFTDKAPRRWVAWPNEKPVIDFAWSEEQWQAVLDKQKARGVKEPSSKGSGHRMLLNRGTDGASFDGLEIINMSYFGFVLRDGQKNLSWRRCRMRNLWADYRENPGFIFTYAVQRTGEREWGKRVKANGYQHMIVQDCHFSERYYWSPRGEHGGAFVLFTVRDSVFEDNVIEKIERGQCFIDKDNGWSNTYRGNHFHGPVMFAGQGCNDEIDFHHNLVEGYFKLGAQPGWVRNMWVHHNTFRGEIILMGGGTQAPIGLKEDRDKYKGPMDKRSQQEVAEWSWDKRTVHFYHNVVRAPKKTGIIMKIVDNFRFAEKWRFVRWENNVLHDSALLQVLWGRKTYPFTELKVCGVGRGDKNIAFELKEDGQVEGSFPWVKTHGIEAHSAQAGLNDQIKDQ